MTKFNKPITWVVVRTVNFTGNNYIVAGKNSLRQAKACAKEYEYADPHGEYQYWYMTTYTAWKQGILSLDKIAPSGRYIGSTIV